MTFSGVVLTEPDFGVTVKIQPLPSVYSVLLSFISHARVPPAAVFEMLSCFAVSLSPNSRAVGETFSCGFTDVVVVFGEDVVVVVFAPPELVVVVVELELEEVLDELPLLELLVVVVLLLVLLELLERVLPEPRRAKKVRVGVLMLVRVMALSVGVIARLNVFVMKTVAKPLKL